jgi:hypothetical protein
MKTGKIFKSTILAIALSLSLSGPLYAKWYYNSGNTGQIQNESVLASPYIYYGWGLDFTLNASTSTWVHVSVPLPYQKSKGVKKIIVEVQMMDNNGSVDAIDVYSGGALLHQFTNVNWGIGNHAEILDMGEFKKLFGPISISIHCQAGAGGSARIVVKRVAADWKLRK